MALLDDCLRVTLQDSSTFKPLPSVCQNGRTFVVAKPGVSWNIKLERIDLNDPDVYQVCLSVDGESVRHSQLLTRTQSTGLCKGHCLAGTAGTATIQAFKFAPASTATSGAVVDNPDAIKAGKIRVQVYTVRYGQRKPTPCVAFSNAPTSAQHASLIESKKFFMAPSLAVEKAAAVTGLQNWCEFEVIKLSEEPFIDETIYYETASTLLLRKVLNPCDAAHRKILQECGDSTTAALMQPSGSASATAAAQLRAQSAGAKVKADKAKVKVEKGSMQKRARDGAGPSGNRGPEEEEEVVDLTSEGMPGLVHQGHTMQKDEFAVCDLSVENSKGAAGAWSIKKKPRITL